MKSIINELWHGNIVPQEDSRNNTKEMKELISYIARHDENLGKLLTEEQKAIFEKMFPNDRTALSMTWYAARLSDDYACLLIHRL